MRVVVRFFALQRQQLGVRAIDVEVPDGATVADAWSAAVERHPVLAESTPVVRFARNAEYVGRDAPLAEGDEVAVIPPVAGGADPPASVAALSFTDRPIDAAAVRTLEEAVGTDEDGAVVTFVGRVRSTPGTPAPGQEAEAERFQGQRVVALEYEAFEPMAERILGSIAAEARERFGASGVRTLHRTGRVAVGEPSVAIAVAAPHRGAAFDACRYVIDELKSRAPIWKSEHFADGSVWLGEPPRTD